MAQKAPCSTRSLIDKLGVKAGQRVAVLGVDDSGFLAQVRGRAGEVITRPGADCDIAFLDVPDRSALAKLSAVRKRIKSNGAIWAVWVKGRPELNENHVRAAALQSGLVDVKVVAFSPTHSALKLVIPVARR